MNEKKCVFLLVLAVTVLTVSCAAPEESFDQDFFRDGSENTDFGGSDLIMGTVSDSFFFEEGTTFHDAMLERFGEIEEKFNCRIVQISPQDDFVIGSFYGGTRYVDIIYSDPLQTARAGALYPLCDLEMDLTDFDTYGTPNLLEYGMQNGIPYAVTPAKWPLSFRGNAGTFVILNEGIIEKYGFTDPRDLCESGAWTLDNFIKYVPDYYISAGEDTVHAIGAVRRNLVKGVFGAFGIPFVTMTESGLRSGYSLTQTPLCIDWFKSFMDECEQYILLSSDWGSYSFVNGNNSVMTLTEFLYIRDIAANVDNFGVVSFPSSTYIEYGKNYSYYYFSSMLSLSGAAPEPDDVCECFKELIRPFGECRTTEDYIDYLTGNVFFDRRDSEFYNGLSKTAIHVYNNFYLDFFDELGSEFDSDTGATFIARNLESFDQHSQVAEQNQITVRMLYQSSYSD